MVDVSSLIICISLCFKNGHADKSAPIVGLHFDIMQYAGCGQNK
jgi:hypothetical protein